MLKTRLSRTIVLFSGATILAFGCLDFGALQGGTTVCADCGDSAIGEASGPGFSITAQPSLTLQQGASASVNITIARTNGFADAIDVTVSGLPAGATSNPLTVTSDTATGSLTIAVAASTPQSLSHLSIDGVSPDGKTSSNAQMDLIVRGPPGSLDSLYGNQGVATGITSGDRYSTLAIALDGSGNLVVSGMQNVAQFSSFACLRLTPDGAADKTFGTNGVFTATFLPQGNFFNGVFPLKSGYTLVTGDIGTNNYDVFARLTPAGALDQSYSPDAGMGYYIDPAFYNGTMTHFATDANGNVIGVGYDTSPTEKVYVMRRTPDGATDPSFEGGGSHMEGIGASSGTGVAIQSNGEIVVVVNATVGSYTGLGVMRLNTSGVDDGTFGSSGLAPPTILTQGNATAIALEPDGKILALGEAPSLTSSFVARYSESDGSLDSGFGSDGVASVAQASAIAVQGDGKIILVGSAAVNGDAGTYDVFSVERLTTGGLPDPTFGNNGFVQTAIGGEAGADPFAVTIQPDGRIVVAGRVNTSLNTSDFAIARYWP